MSRKILASLIFAHICGLALGQMRNDCMVSVFDARTREPVVAATVVVEGLQGGIFTDTLGHFQLNNKHLHARITIRSIGYNTWTGAFDTRSDTQTILLEPVDNVLGTVVVSGTLKEVSKDASPIPVEIFTPRYFQKNASPTIFEALTMVNGVRPQLNCNVCNTGDIHINGLEGPYTMVTLDGMPIVSGLSTVYGLSGIPNGMVERIEVVKGPAGTLYGSEAVGGLINIITKNALTAPRLFADVFGISTGELNADLAGATQFGKTHTLLGINYFNFQNRIDINRDNFTDVALQERISVFNKWNLEQKHNRSASLAWRYVHEDRWGGELQWEPRWRGTDSVYGESIRTDRIEVLAKYELPLKSRRIALDLSWNLHDQNSAYGKIPFLGRQEVAFAQASTDLPLGPFHDALLGAALRYTDYDDNTPATAAPDGIQNRPARTWLPGVFVQDEIQINRRNRLLLGLRYDHHSAHGHILTPRVSWKWAEDAQHILRLTAGSGYRVANIFTEDHAALTGAREVVIAEGLLPERSWNANLNYVRKFFPKQAGFIGLDGSLFFTYFSNQIVPNYDSDPNKIIYANLDGYGISRGVSLNLDINFLSGLKIIAGATAMDVYRVENGQKLPQYFAPPLSANWTLSYPIPRWRLTLDYTGNLNSPMHLPVQPNDPRPPQSPWFSVHNVQATWKVLQNLEIYMGIKNLLGFFPREEVILRAFDPFDKYVHVDNPLGLTFDPSYNYAPVQRQRVLLGVRWTMEKTNN